VAAELHALVHPAGGPAIRAAMNDGWLAVEPLPLQSDADRLLGVLDPGEAEAIALSAATAADVLLLDERRGRIQARTLGLNVGGVLGELLHAKLAGRIPSMRSEIHRLRTDARFFIGANIEAFFVAQAGEA
jgi:predicted nucleic acid-binding protein